MSLEGNLSAFGLSEILQLIALQRKTGVLSISRQSISLALYFREGKVISTRDRRRSARDPLKDYLARYGVISREELARLTRISTESRLDLADVILSESTMSTDAFDAHGRNHIQETIHDILTWEQCSYRFTPGTDTVEGVKSLGEFGVEGLLMESMRRIDEFPAMLKEFPDGGMTVKKHGEPGESGESGESSEPRMSAEDQELTRNESMILEVLSRETSINDLVSRAQMPRFETYEALKRLKEKNLIEVEKSRILEPESNIARKIAKKSRSGRRRNPLPLLLSIVVFVSSAFWGARGILPLVRTGSGAGQRLAITMTKNDSPIRRDQIEEKLRWYLESHRAMHGTYPTRLSSLEERGGASHTFLDEVAAFSFRYYLTPEGDRYTLL